LFQADHPGESAPISGTLENTNANFLETRCIGLQGTHCISGSAVGIVIGTGDRTVFGQIAKLTNEPKTGFTPLERDIFNFVIIIFSLMASMITLCVIVW
jgi:sodium/potassium-transporting ATPase subunit alpha